MKKLAKYYLGTGKSWYRCIRIKSKDIGEMVRYLGLDYLKLAVQRKQEFLKRALIAVPEHIEVIEKYTHHGGIEDIRFRKPWTRAQYDGNFLDGEKQKGITFDLSLSDIKLEETSEKFGSNTDNVELGFFDLDDFAGSYLEEIFDDHFDEYTIPTDCGTSDEKKKAAVVEVYKKDFLTNDFEKTIEEPLTNVFLLPQGDNLLSLLVLSQRLHQTQIKDPFSVEDLHNFKSQCSLKEEKPADKPNKVFFKEEYCRFIVQEDEKLLEETILPFASHAYKLDQSPSVEVELDVNPIEMSDEEEITLLPYGLNLNIERESLEKDTVVANNVEFFLKVNKIKYGNEIEKSLLDSPLTTDRLKLEPESLNLSLLTMPLLMFDLRHKFTCRERILTIKEKESIEKGLWQQEKYFDDILCMRIPEPDIQSSLMSHGTHLQTILNQKEIRTDTSFGEVELALNWDPIGNSGSMQKRNGCVEEINFNAKQLISFRKFDIKIEKYSAEMYEWQDKTIEIDNKKRSFCELEDKDLELDNDQWVVTSITKRTNSLETSSGTNEPVLEEDNFGFNQIDDFFSLRTGLQPPKTIKSVGPDIQESSEINNENSKNYIEHDDTSSMVSSEIIAVSLGDKHQEILNIVQEKLSSFISVLLINGVDVVNQDLTTDYTRFLLKQTEKQMNDTPSDGNVYESYKAAVCLHALTGAKDILKHCCLESAIAHLQAIEDKYKATFTGGLEEIRQRLFKWSCDFNQRNIYHPKLMALCKEVEKWLQPPDNNKKVLVILKRQYPSLVKTVMATISHCPGVKLKTGDSKQIEKMKSSIEDFNCMIIIKDLIGKEFPWTKFSLVLEYEYEIQYSCRKVTNSHNMKYIGFTVKVKEPHCYSQEDMSAPEIRPLITELEQGTIIGSSRILSCGDMLQLLETRYNLIVIERDYCVVEKTVYFSDIDVDEKSCIILHMMSDLSDESQLEPFLKKVVSLSLKYTKCWILLCTFSKSKNNYPYAGKYVSNLFKLQASLGTFISRQSSFDTKIIACRSVEETCSEIRKICDIERATSSVWDKDDWSNDCTWIQEKASKEETFLLPIPCLSSLNCQIILKKMTLKELLSSSEEKLRTTLSVIPEKVVKMLYTVIQSNQGFFSKLTSAKRQSISDYLEPQIVEKSANISQGNTTEDMLGFDTKTTESRSKYFSKGETVVHQPKLNRKFKQYTDKLDNNDMQKQVRLEEIESNNNVFNSLKNTHYEMNKNISNEKSLGQIDIDSKDDESVLQYAYELTDDRNIGTQDTNDVWSLNGSQPSVIVNEYERAEMEGNVNRKHRVEMETFERFDEERMLKYGCNFSPSDIQSGDWSRDVKYARVTPTSHSINRKTFEKSDAQLDKKKLKRNTVPKETVYGHNCYMPHGRERLAGPRSIVKEIQFNSVQKQSVRPYLNSNHCVVQTKHKEKYSVGENTKNGFQQHGGMENQLTYQEPEINGVQSSHSDSRSFSRNLSETTKNILQQAYKSPRFGVKPFRPFSQRISVGLAQPLPRQSSMLNRRREEGVNTQSCGRSDEIEISSERLRPVDDSCMNRTRRNHDGLPRDEGGRDYHREREIGSAFDSVNSPILKKNNSNFGKGTNKQEDFERGHQSTFSKVRKGLNQSLKMENTCLANRHIENEMNGLVQQAVTPTHDLSYSFSGECREIPGYMDARNCLMEGGNYSISLEKDDCYELLNRKISVNRQISAIANKKQNFNRQWNEYDSPPMDLDYLQSPQIVTEDYEDCQTDTTNRLLLTSDQCIPTKKRRLGFVKHPGSKGGQTKLVFK